MRALVTLAVEIAPEGYEQEYGVEPHAAEVLDYTKVLVAESATIRLNLVGGWAKITNVEVTPPIEGPAGRSWEEVWGQVRQINATDHLSKMVAVAIPSPFLEPPGTYVVAYVDRETRIQH
jgi:hypothetical protein